jgi:hypothetical protein
MMTKLALIALAAALAAAGCETDLFPGATSTTPGTGDRSDAPDSQADAYTILLYVLNDPVRHVQDADTIIETLGWQGLFAVHKGGHSELFWGRYDSPEKADKNLKAAKAYRTPGGVPLFAKAMVVPLPGSDIGPKQWRLDGLDAQYSLLVAVFKDVPDRKYLGRRRRAVEYCQRLRDHGYESYFQHGKVVSHVTIGAFGREAVRERKTRRGQTLEILDPRIKKLREDFPELQVNGNIVTDIFRDRHTGKITRRVTRQSHLIRIPRSQGNDAR